MKLSLSLGAKSLVNQKISFREILLRGFRQEKKLPIEEISELTRKNIIDGIELVLSDKTTGSEIKQIKKILKRNKIPILSIHQPIQKILKIDFVSILKLFKIAKELSAQVIVIHLSALGKNINNPNFVYKIRLLEKKYQIKIGAENGIKIPLPIFSHRNSWNAKNFSRTIKKINLKITLDTTHMGYSGGDIINFYNKNKDKIINIHLSDFKGNILGMHRPLEEGRLPIRKFLKILRRLNYQGIITLEIDSGWKKIKNSIKLVNSLIK